MSIDNVEDIVPRVQYVAAALQTVFDYPFPIFQDADLVVDVDGVAKTLVTHYTVTGEGEDTGGDVTFSTAMAGGEIVTIYRDIAIERTSDFQQNGPWASVTTNDEFDRITLILQQLESRIGRAVRLSLRATQPSADLEIDNAFDDKFLYINSSGELVPAASVTGQTLTQALIAGLLFPQTAAELAVGVTPTDYSYRPMDVRRYGALGDGVTNDAPAFQKAINIAKYSGETINVPAPPSGGAYLLTSALNCTISVADTASGANSRGFTFRGEGNQLGVTDSITVRPILLAKHTGHVFDCTGSYGINFENLSIGTDATTYPKTCFFFARNTAGAGSFHRVDKCRVFGKFSESILYNYGAEEDTYYGCQFSNREGGANARVLTFTAYNHRTLTSSFTTVATGQQSTIGHWIFGGSFQNFSHNATADIVYVDAINLLRIFGGHWICADSTGGGRSLVYVSTANAASNELMLLGFGGEVSAPACPTYGVYIGDAVATCAGIIFENSRLPNATDMIRAHANVTFSTSKFRNVTNASSGGGVNILGTLADSDHFGQAGAFSVGTYKQNNIIQRNGEVAFSLIDSSAASGKKNFRHRSVGGQYVITLYADDNATNLGNPLVLTSNGSAISNVALIATSYSLSVAGLGNFANDAAAAAGGVPVGNLYRNGSILMVRVA